MFQAPLRHPPTGFGRHAGGRRPRHAAAATVTHMAMVVGETADTSFEEAAHLHELCGARVTINVPMPWREVRYPLVSPTPVRREPYDSTQPVPEDFLAASVVPESALLVTLLVSADGATFVDTHQREGLLYMARPRYQLRNVVAVRAPPSRSSRSSRAPLRPRIGV